MEIQETAKNKILYLTSLLYFTCGFITATSYILIPYLKKLFDLSYVAAVYVQFFFYIAAFILSIPAARLVSRIGYKLGMIISLMTMGLGYLLFAIATHFESYSNFLIGFFVVSCGLTLLQVALNTYVTILGNPAKASSRLSILAALNALGATCAAPITSFFILKNSISVNQNVTQMPYLGLSLLLMLLLFVTFVFKFPKPLDTNLNKIKIPILTESNKSIWQFRHLWLGALAYFAYLGAEVSIASFLVSFIASPHISNFSLLKAGAYVSFYWIGSMIGRLIGFFTLRKLKSNLQLSVHAALAVILITVTLLSHGKIAMYCILAVGLCNSIMFPTIYSLTLNGLGKYTETGGGILCTFSVGAAIIPLLQAVLADRLNVHYSFFVPLCCYVYVLSFALFGHRLNYYQLRRNSHEETPISSRN